MNHDSGTAATGLSRKIVPVGAGFGALTSLLSCLPLSAATALGAVGLSAALRPYRWWLVAVSTVFIILGFVEERGRPRGQRRAGRLVVLSASLFFVLLVVLATVAPRAR